MTRSTARREGVRGRRETRDRAVCVCKKCLLLARRRRRVSLWVWISPLMQIRHWRLRSAQRRRRRRAQRGERETSSLYCSLCCCLCRFRRFRRRSSSRCSAYLPSPWRDFRVQSGVLALPDEDVGAPQLDEVEVWPVPSFFFNLFVYLFFMSVLRHVIACRRWISANVTPSMLAYKKPPYKYIHIICTSCNSRMGALY